MEDRNWIIAIKKNPRAIDQIINSEHKKHIQSFLDRGL